MQHLLPCAEYFCTRMIYRRIISSLNNFFRSVFITAIVSFIFALFTTHSTRYKNIRKWTYTQDDALRCFVYCYTRTLLTMMMIQRLKYLCMSQLRVHFNHKLHTSSHHHSKLTRVKSVYIGIWITKHLRETKTCSFYERAMISMHICKKNSI